MRLTVSPSTTLSQSPNSTTPTLSCSRLRASPVTSCGSSSISSAMQFSSPWTRAMPSATESTVPTSERSASPASMPSIRSRRIFEISSGLISTVALLLILRVRRLALRATLAFLSQVLSSLLARCSRRGPCCRPAARGRRGCRGRPRSRGRPCGRSAARSPCRPGRRRSLSSSTALVRRHLEPLVLLRPELVEASADAEDRRHPVLLGEQLEEVDCSSARRPRPPARAPRASRPRRSTG